MDTDAVPRFLRGNVSAHFCHDDNILPPHNPNIFICFP